MFVYIIELKQETELQQGLELFFQKYSYISILKYTVKKTDNETIEVELIFNQRKSLNGEQHRELNKIFSQETKLLLPNLSEPKISIPQRYRYMEITYEQTEEMIQKFKELLLKHPRYLLQYRIHQTESKVQIEYDMNMRTLISIHDVFKDRTKAIREENVDDDINWLDWTDFNSSMNVIHKM